MSSTKNNSKLYLNSYDGDFNERVKKAKD